MRRHLLILLTLTILVRGWMMISYPLGGTDDNQAGQRYLIDQLLHGNLLIGNLRYQPGYPLVIAPVVALSQPLGRFDDRFVLLVQVAISSTSPFMVYDILRRRRSAREALIVALLVLLDPFGLQWAHFYLPEWLIAFCMIFALWLVDRGVQRGLRWTVFAGLVLGVGALARFNFAPIVGLIGGLFFALRSLTWRRRLLMFATLGVISGGMLVLYLVLIQHPSTGTWQFSCISGINLLESSADKGMTIRAENGAASAEYLDLTSRFSTHEILFLADTYPNWQQPGAWASPEELEAFRNNTVRQGYPVTGNNLNYFLGACPTDDLLRRVFIETVRAEPAHYLLAVLTSAAEIIVQFPGTDNPRYLPAPEQLVPISSSTTLGFQQVQGWEYTGEWLWVPGVELFSAVFAVWNAYKWLTPLALVWALRSRDWFYATAAFVLVVGALMLAAVDNYEARIYSWMYPLAPIVIGGMVAVLLRRLGRAV